MPYEHVANFLVGNLFIFERINEFLSFKFSDLMKSQTKLSEKLEVIFPNFTQNSWFSEWNLAMPGGGCGVFTKRERTFRYGALGWDGKLCAAWTFQKDALFRFQVGAFHPVTEWFIKLSREHSRSVWIAAPSAPLPDVEVSTRQVQGFSRLIRLSEFLYEEIPDSEGSNSDCTCHTRLSRADSVRGQRPSEHGRRGSSWSELREFRT